jgi:hypothetical protein
MARAKKQTDVFDVPALERHELVALQMCFDEKENAEPEQQAIAIRAIIGKICLYDIQAYQVGSFDETAFLNGRVFVGKEILRQCRAPIGEMDAQLKQEKTQ